ncbi:General stress protein 69 [Ruegeria sp. THAF57]|uniref:aldo/keto reductase n=1 Tax=Ruegeria sp. THAF57 TaxID=2744555 RepID=UPI0015E045F8|nr:aldo/keto reductase [Ruegeria sp. THAF57]CAD0185414.1 General stress protein 69 [Ruegeria sp. THAF57]
MEMKPLGRTGIMVTDLCLGTMTFGTQTTEADAHTQIDMALDAGINFVDAAEMYPVNPISKETVGRTEEILGNWNAAHSSRRADYVLATKHSGAGFAHARDGAPISGQTIPEAIEGSLRRLKTDCIDLYQFHWPNRGSYMFRQNWTYAPSGHNTDEVLDNMRECLEALQAQVDKGNIRAFGLSNESAWGTAQWLRLAEDGAGPRVASVQNEYSLMCRHFDTDMAELSVHEDVGLMAFSPLAAGFLTGKYQGGAVPEGSRMSLVPEMGGRHRARAFDAVEAYLEVAARHGLDPVHMALAWCQTRPFMMSAIFGATSVEQLAHILSGKDLQLSDEVLADITEAHRAHPMPF